MEATFDASPTEAAHVRRFLADKLTGLVLPGPVDDAVLAVDRLALPLARRRYRQVMAEIEQAYDALVRTDDPMDRHILLERRARLTSDLADLHNAAFGDGPVEGVADMAGVLRVQAMLQHLVAATELSASMATWAPAIEV